MVKKIVLTGGPCAGKTTALAKIEQDLISLGYKVFVVGESATELIKSGVRPFGDKCLNLVEFQKIIMLYQLQKEEIYNKVLEQYTNDNVVIIYDRGILDNKAYINDQQFKEVLNYISYNKNKKICEEDLLDRYDMVIHLVTAADGKKEAYTLNNNSTRTEGIEEAIKLDKKTMNAWIRHPNLKIIDNEESFNTKIDNVMQKIYELLNNPIILRTQLKFNVELENYALEQIKKNYIPLDIEQIYLKNNFYEERIRKVTTDNNSTYYYTKQIKKENGESEVIINKRISHEEYNLLKNTCEIEDIIYKRRYTFIIDKQYYRLDEYDNYYILELEITDKNKKINIPEGIHIKKEMTKKKTKISNCY